MHLQDKTALVTGSDSGIGQAIAVAESTCGRPVCRVDLARQLGAAG